MDEILNPKAFLNDRSMIQKLFIINKLTGISMSIYEGWLPNFTPSQGTLKSMLRVRKNAIYLDGRLKPGVFGFNGWTMDTMASILVVVLECVGAYFIIEAVQSTQDPYEPDSNMFLAFGVVVVALLLDIVLAWFHQIFKTGEADFLSLENLKLSQDGTIESQNKIAKNQNRLQYLSKSCSVLAALVFLLAAVKVICVTMLVQGDVDTESSSSVGDALAFLVLYFLTAYLHVNNTGYWMFGCVARRLVKWELKRFVTNPNVKDGVLNANWITSNEVLPKEIDWSGIFFSNEYPDQETSNTKLFLLKLSEGGYRLCVKGVLTDQMMQNAFHSLQNQNAQQQFLKAAIAMQYAQCVSLFGAGELN